MRDAFFLLVAFGVTYLAFACLALAQRQHWQAVTGATDCSLSGKRMLKTAGVAGLAAGLAVILWREGPDYGSLLWVTQLVPAAFCVVATLSMKPRLLKLLAAIPARA
jgi:Protein of unknown function (DUF3325)